MRSSDWEGHTDKRTIEAESKKVSSLTFVLVLYIYILGIIDWWFLISWHGLHFWSLWSPPRVVHCPPKETKATTDKGSWFLSTLCVSFYYEVQVYIPGLCVLCVSTCEPRLTQHLCEPRLSQHFEQFQILGFSLFFMRQLVISLQKYLDYFTL